VHAGESYADNLRRFYASRLSADEAPNAERYVIEGIARHRAQRAPYEFFHNGKWLRVASLPIPDIGRVRLWQELHKSVKEAGSPDEVGRTRFSGPRPGESEPDASTVGPVSGDDGIVHEAPIMPSVASAVSNAAR